MSDVAGLSHVNLRASAEMIERLRVFYRDVIGLRDGPRPLFRSRGYWMYAGGRDVLHLTVDPAATAAAAAAPTGCFNHVAFALADLDAARARLVAAGVEYELDEVPSGGTAQVFLHDPAGVGVELAFAGSDATATRSSAP